MNVSVDLNPPLLGPNGQPTKEAGIVRVHAVGTNGSNIGLTVTLEPYRTEQPAVFGGPFYQHACYPRFEHPDAIDTTSGVDAVTWVHWNHINTTFFNDTIRDQGVDPSAHPDLIDPFTHRAFGGQISGKGLTAVKGSAGLAVGTGKDEKLTDVEVQVKLLTKPDTDPTTWRATIDKLQPAPGGVSALSSLPRSVSLMLHCWFVRSLRHHSYFSHLLCRRRWSVTDQLQARRCTFLLYSWEFL